MSKIISIIIVLLIALNPIASYGDGGTATLKQSPLTNPSDLSSFSTSNVTICGSQAMTFYISYSYSSHISCHSDKYRFILKLYRNGVLVSSTPKYTDSHTSQEYIFGMGGTIVVTPGIYHAEATLERRPCIGNWYTAGTAVTNSIVVSSNATPDFSINGVAAGDPNTGTIPSIVCHSSNIIMNASNSSCESSYWVGVWETTSNWQQRTYDYEWGGWFQGQAPNGIDLQYLAVTSSSRWINGPNNRKNNILMGGTITNATTPSYIGRVRYYTIELCTGEPSWQCKKMQIRVIW